MAYPEGLGQINIARDSSALIRSLQYQLQQRTATPVAPRTAVLIRSAPTTTVAPKPTPVLTIGTKTTTPPPSPTPVFKTTVSAPKPVIQTVGMKPAPAGSIITSRAENVGLVSTLTKSPLPLIAIGLGALLLFNRKKGR